MKIIKNSDNTLSIDLFKKKTFSARDINYLSAHSTSVKIGIVKNLVDKVLKLSDPQFHNKNLELLKKDLLLNNYPIAFINKQIKNKLFQYKNQQNHGTDINNNNNEQISEFDYKKIFVLPYLGDFTKKIQYTVKKKFNINTVYTSPFKLNTIIKLQKDKLSLFNNKYVVYNIKCKDCDQNYIGQTKRLLNTRCVEHKKTKISSQINIMLSLNIKI